MRSSSVWVVGALAGAAVASAATVVLQVNGVGITDADLAQTKRSIAAQQKGTADEQAVMHRAVEQVIGHALLVQAAREAGTKVEPSEVEARVAAQRSRYPSPEAFAQALQAGGTSERELARREEENLLILHFTEDRLGPQSAVSSTEARAYYDLHPDEFVHPEQAKIRMILVSVPEVASPEVDDAAKLRVARAFSRLAAGEDFATVAKEISDDATKTRGGEVGWVRRGQLLPELEAAVFDLKAGEFSKPIRSKYGYHVMGVTVQRGPGQSSFEEVEPALTSMLKGIKVREAMRKLVSERRANAKIETLDPEIKAALAAPVTTPAR
jgi:parvulin-like peptidyl-prolyl isomerase